MWRLETVIDGKYVWRKWRAVPTITAMLRLLGVHGRAEVHTDEFAWMNRDQFWGGR